MANRIGYLKNVCTDRQRNAPLGVFAAHPNGSVGVLPVFVAVKIS
ncbi:hypothetical protein [Thalassoroseus pseudoceratinae]|nr:hypothetical protein [Thalassoroseus pseudoceratinae]